VAVAGLAVLALAAAGAVTLYVAATTAIGPTVFELTPTHGVHLGDVTVGAVAFTGAICLPVAAAVATAGRTG
jgi:hypothetical protein